MVIHIVTSTAKSSRAALASLVHFFHRPRSAAARDMERCTRAEAWADRVPSSPVDKCA